MGVMLWGAVPYHRVRHLCRSPYTHCLSPEGVCYAQPHFFSISFLTPAQAILIKRAPGVMRRKKYLASHDKKPSVSAPLAGSMLTVIIVAPAQ